MQKKYTVSLLVVMSIILLNIFIYFQYCSYLAREYSGEAITLVSDDLSINYFNGNKISLSKEEESIRFSITNHSSDTVSYTIFLKNMKGDFSEASYELVEEGKNTPSKKSFENNILVSRVSIDKDVTERYEMKIYNPKSEKISFQIETQMESIDNSFASLILKNNEVQTGPKTLFSESPLEEGLIGRQEQYGTVYYFRGNVINNYVRFAGMDWRIVKINEDKTVKLILDRTTENMVKMNENESTDFSSSSMSLYLDEWYNTKLKDYDDSITSTNYCLDDTVLKDEEGKIEYLSFNRLFTDYLPTNTCAGTSISTKIGLLTADEAMFAGANSLENKTFYLHLDSLQAAWWTMTPTKRENEKTSYFVVSQNGVLQTDALESSSLFARPVITLVKKVKAEGSGTKDDPYVCV